VRADRLRLGELLAGGSALLLFAVMFLDWYELRLTPLTPGGLTRSAGYSAWGAFSIVDLFLALTVVAAVALVYAQATRPAPALPVSLSVIVTVIGGVAVVLIVIRIAAVPRLGDATSVLGPHYAHNLRIFPAAVRSLIARMLDRHLTRSLQPGAFLGLLGAIGIAVGGYLSMRKEGISPRDAPGGVETVSLAATS
jgi:hypothetical protein